MVPGASAALAYGLGLVLALSIAVRGDAATAPCDAPPRAAPRASIPLHPCAVAPDTQELAYPDACRALADDTLALLRATAVPGHTLSPHVTLQLSRCYDCAHTHVPQLGLWTTQPLAPGARVLDLELPSGDGSGSGGGGAADADVSAGAAVRLLTDAWARARLSAGKWLSAPQRKALEAHTRDSCWGAPDGGASSGWYAAVWLVLARARARQWVAALEHQATTGSDAFAFDDVADELYARLARLWPADCAGAVCHSRTDTEAILYPAASAEREFVAAAVQRDATERTAAPAAAGHRVQLLEPPLTQRDPFYSDALFEQLVTCSAEKRQRTQQLAAVLFEGDDTSRFARIAAAAGVGVDDLLWAVAFVSGRSVAVGPADGSTGAPPVVGVSPVHSFLQHFVTDRDATPHQALHTSHGEQGKTERGVVRHVLAVPATKAGEKSTPLKAGVQLFDAFGGGYGGEHDTALTPGLPNRLLWVWHGYAVRRNTHEFLPVWMPFSPFQWLPTHHTLKHIAKLPPGQRDPLHDLQTAHGIGAGGQTLAVKLALRATPYTYLRPDQMSAAPAVAQARVVRMDTHRVLLERAGPQLCAQFRVELNALNRRLKARLDALNGVGSGAALVSGASEGAKRVSRVMTMNAQILVWQAAPYFRKICPFTVLSTVNPNAWINVDSRVPLWNRDAAVCSNAAAASALAAASSSSSAVVEALLQPQPLVPYSGTGMIVGSALSGGGDQRNATHMLISDGSGGSGRGGGDAARVVAAYCSADTGAAGALTVIRDLFTATEVAELMAHATDTDARTAPMWVDSEVNPHASDRRAESVVASDVRQAASATLRPHQFLGLQERVARWLGVPLLHMEWWQIVRYVGDRQFYDLHADAFGAERVRAQNGRQRITTVFVYLNSLPDDDGGGYTQFPDLGVRVRPVAGTAVLWNDTLWDDQSGRPTVIPADEYLHGGEPAQRPGSVKYGVNIWVQNARARYEQLPEDVAQRAVHARRERTARQRAQENAASPAPTTNSGTRTTAAAAAATAADDPAPATHKRKRDIPRRK